jgi:hypothetical protein
MRLHIAAIPSPCPLVRVFHHGRLAPAALAQVYELLLPGARRSLPLSARPTAPPAPVPRRAAAQ